MRFVEERGKFVGRKGSGRAAKRATSLVGNVGVFDDAREAERMATGRTAAAIMRSNHSGGGSFVLSKTNTTAPLVGIDMRAHGNKDVVATFCDREGRFVSNGKTAKSHGSRASLPLFGSVASTVTAVKTETVCSYARFLS